MRSELVERELLSQPVRSLQYMLRRISLVDEYLPQLKADGVFGEETLEAVMLFQRERHPPVTGEVDLDTWNAIRDRWDQVEQSLGEARPVRVYPAGNRQVEPGSTNEFMILPQTMFQVLSEYLEGITVHDPNGTHGPESSQNTRWLQRAAGLQETGIMDRRTWDMLSRLYEVFADKSEGERSGFAGGWG